MDKNVNRLQYNFIITMLFAFLLVPLCAYAAQPLVLSSGTDSYRLGGFNLDILEDTTGQLTITDVVSPRYAVSFKQSQQQVPNFGITDSAFWLRFTLSASGNHPMLLFLDQPLMSEADLYLPDERGGFRVLRAGATLPMELHTLPGRDILFPLTITATPQTCYLRTRIAGRAQMPLSLMTESAMHERQAVMGYLIGGFTGAMLLMAMISLGLFFLIREQSFLHYTLFALAVLMGLLVVYGYPKVWALPVPLSSLDLLPILIGNVGLLIGTQFARSFLMTKQHTPRFDTLLKWLFGYHLVSLIFPVLLSVVFCKQLLNLVILLNTLVIVSAAIACYRKGVTTVRYFLIARLLFYVGGGAFTLANISILPVNMVTGNIFLFSALLDVLLIAVAMGDRFREINQRNWALVADLRREVDDRVAANRAMEEQITERNRLEREVVRISDEERRRFSHELHDGLCQKLASARLYCSMAITGEKSSHRDAAFLEPMQKLLQESVDDAYNLSRGLWPLEHDPQGKKPLLADLVERLSVESGVIIVYDGQDEFDTVPAVVLTQIYRIAQEAIVNALKHSGADHISVSLHVTDAGEIVLAVQDNGQGIVAGTVTPGGMGMNIMRHRAGMIGGELEIRSIQAKGTRVVCRAPVMKQGGTHDGI
jgi:signal transduction histidine kinase